mmetsp:Transcript_35146/g.80464  ORF Transcript_35146/g.80464 Transcript_35146/m.80464 type:complete len:457 (+) Transcript_35146:32-1402(+)
MSQTLLEVGLELIRADNGARLIVRDADPGACGIRNRGGEALARVLNAERQIRALDITNSGMSDNGIGHLCVKLRQTDQLEELYVSPVGRNGFQFVLGVVNRCQRLKKLRIEVHDVPSLHTLRQKLSDEDYQAWAHTGKKPEGEEEEEEEEEDEEEVDEAAVAALQAKYQNKGQRSSVSAEVYGQWNEKKDFVPPKHEKSQEQRERIRSVLSQSFLFAALEEEDIGIIVDAIVIRAVGAQENIIVEGEDGSEMFVIMEGKFECIKKIDGSDKVVKTCGVGDFFGELALLYNAPRAATVQAAEASMVLQLDRETFNHIVRDGSMKKRNQYDEFLKSVALLATLGQYERMQLADALRKESVPAGTIVVRQGDAGDKFFIVESGNLVATKKNDDGSEKEVMKYKTGDYFGELALLRGNVRQASVSATSDCKLLAMETKIFKQLLGSLEAIMKRNAEGYST